VDEEVVARIRPPRFYLSGLRVYRDCGRVPQYQLR